MAKFGDEACRCRMAGCKGWGRAVVCCVYELWLGCEGLAGGFLMMVNHCGLLVSFRTLVLFHIRSCKGVILVLVHVGSSEGVGVSLFMGHVCCLVLQYVLHCDSIM